MLRVILWRLTFELANLLKVLGYRGADRYYFAYGANLDPEVMKSRRMTIIACTPGRISGFVLRFNHEVPFQGIGMASIEESAGFDVHGMLYTIPRVDEWIMDCCESYRFLHRYEKSRLKIGDKSCFYYRSARPLPGLLPSRAYLEKILNGYKKYFPPDSPFIKEMESQPSLPEMRPLTPPRFLVVNYGKWGPLFRPMLELYDRVCVKVFVFFIFRPSLFK